MASVAFDLQLNWFEGENQADVNWKLIDGAELLLQKIKKILLQSKGTDPFDPNYGNEGVKYLPLVIENIDDFIAASAEALQYRQQLDAQNFDYMPEEKLGSYEFTKVDESNLTLMYTSLAEKQGEITFNINE